MEHENLNLGSDESCAYQYLRSHGDEFVSEMEVARRADGVRRFKEEPRWAHVALGQLVDKKLVETDGGGRYRIPPLHPEGEKEAKPEKFIDPRLRKILERSKRKIDLSGFE